MIRIEHLTKCFGDLAAVDDLSLTIASGEIFGFLGPNGAGKTTTVKVLTGLMRPTAGRVFIAGYDVAAYPLEAKRVTGLVPDQPFVYPKLTGTEFLQFVGRLYRVPEGEQKKKIPELLEMFELQDWANELVESYSHGMRQKLVIAGVLLHQPKVLILDEPMVGLDPRSARMVKEILQRLAGRGAAVFLCTHILEIAEKICHRIGIIMSGRLFALGTQKELRDQSKAQGALEDVFLSLTGSSPYQDLLKYL